MSDEEPPYYVDRAKGGRAKCKGCKQPCEGGELRFAKMVIGPYGEGKPMKTWYHVQCAMDAFMKQRPKTRRVTCTDDIGNFAQLSSEDKALLLDKINETERNYAKKHKLDFSDITENSEAPKAATDNMASAPSASSAPDSKYDLTHRDNSFQQFCSLCINIASDSKYTVKTAIVENFFNKGSDGKGFKSDIALWCRLLLPGVVKRIYNLKSKQLVKLFGRILGTDLSAMLKDLEMGNVAETIKVFFGKSSFCTPAKDSTLTVFEVDTFLEELSQLTKEDEQSHHFLTIIRKCTLQDMKYLIYLINGDIRINSGAKHILNAIHPDAYKVFESSRDIDSVIAKVLGSKKHQVEAGIDLMKPVRPMLAEACKSTEMAMTKCPNGMLSEIKYDGERVQLHKAGNEFKFFSRALKPVMDHKVARFKEFIPKAFPHGHDMILDSEVLMVDTQTGELLPFGSLGIHKKTEFKNAEVCLIVFDCIYFNGKSLVDEPICKRREILKKNMTPIKNHVALSEVKEIHDEDTLKNMIYDVLQSGQEGLVLKDLQSKYEPGKRHWLKVKKDYLFDGAMADCADLVVLGAWFGTGKKGGMLSIFLMGCFDESKNKWLTVTKVHGGFDDSSLEGLQKPLLENMTQIFKESARVPSWLNCTKTMVPDYVANDPKNQPVWEITGAEFTKANIHTADGISIRFPRVTKVRDDKCWQTATSLSELKVLFENSKTSSNLDLLQSNIDATSPSKRSAKEREVVTKKIKLDDDDAVVTSSQSSMKTPPLLDEREVVTKKIKLDDDAVVTSSQSSMKTPPLPDVFKGCILKFFTKEKEKLQESKIKEFMRYFIAYGGVMDESEDGSEATHFVHFNDEINMKDIESYGFKCSNFARHLTLKWLKHSIAAKERMSVRRYSVVLVN